jgi:hypothetical protein
MTTPYPHAPEEFPSVFNGTGRQMFDTRIAIWSHLKSDYQIYSVNREDYPAFRLTPTNTNRTNSFYFAAGPGDTQARTFTLYRPRARLHSHVVMGVWHTGGWLCRLNANNTLEGILPILSVSDPAKLPWVGNVGLNIEGCRQFQIWLHFQTPSFYRPILHNRILQAESRLWEEDEGNTAPNVSSTLSNAPTPVPLFVAETLAEKAILAEETCPISMDFLQKGEIAVTSCFHIFQADALAEWCTKHSTCPVCKKDCATTRC